MQQFIDKLISRLEEILPFTTTSGDYIRKKDVIEIVNQLADDYELFGNSEQVKDDWIPVSERLPEAYDISSKPILERPWYLIQTKQGAYAVANYEILYGVNEWISNSFIYRDIVAWQPITHYQK